MLPLLLLAGGLALGSTYMQYQAAEEQKKSSRFQQAANDIRIQRERIASIRQARIQRAQLVSQAEVTGTSASSGAQGGQASIASQVATGLSASQSMQSLGNAVSAAERKATGFLQTANIFAAGSDAAMLGYRAKRPESSKG